MPEEIVMLEDLEEVAPNKYLAINIAAKRARHLVEGERPLIETSAVKPATIALQELVQDKLAYSVRQVSIETKRTLEIEDVLIEDEDESLLEDIEYIDDTDLIVDDEEPEEGL